MLIDNNSSKPNTAASVPELERQRHWQRGFRWICFALCFCMLSGCTRTIEDDFDDYHQRIARLLNTQVPTTPLPDNPRMPRVQQLQSDIPELSIGLLASSRLNQCRAGALIAERNSSLGRVQALHARLLYEIRIMGAIEDCLASGLFDNSELQITLESALQQKYTTLPLWIERFLTSDDIIRSRLRISRRALVLDGRDSASASIAALDYFADVFTELAQDPAGYAVHPSDWALHMRTLGQQDFLSDLWRTQQVTHRQLHISNELLMNAAETMGCNGPHTPQSAHYLKNVMMTFWIQGLQPQLAQLQSHQIRVNESLRRLMAHTDKPVWEAYIESLIGEHSLSEQNLDLIRSHAHHWQQFLAQCNVPIGGSSLSVTTD